LSSDPEGRFAFPSHGRRYLFAFGRSHLGERPSDSVEAARDSRITHDPSSGSGQPAPRSTSTSDSQHSVRPRAANWPQTSRFACRDTGVLPSTPCSTPKRSAS